MLFIIIISLINNQTNIDTLEAGDCSVFPLFFSSLEKWLKRLICYRNGCQIISWPSIMNWFTAAAVVKTPGLILAGGALMFCPVPPTEPLPPSLCHGAHGSDVNLGRLHLQWPSSVVWTLDVNSGLMYELHAETSLCSQQIIAACVCCSFRFIPCPPGAIESNPQICVSIIFSSPPSFIPYKVCVWALCFLSLFYLAVAAVLWTWIIPDYT